MPSFQRIFVVKPRFEKRPNGDFMILKCEFFMVSEYEVFMISEYDKGFSKGLCALQRISPLSRSVELSAVANNHFKNNGKIINNFL